MALVLDTGPVVALLDSDDPDHRRCAELLTGSNEDLVIPTPVLVEIDYWVIKLGGPDPWAEFVTEITDGVFRLEHPTEGDLARCAELERQYADLDLGLVEVSVIAVCERLGEKKVATLDHRHFSIVKPRHCRRLQLLPG